MKRLFALLAITALVLTGCQGQSAPVDDNATEEPVPQEQPVEETTEPQQDQNVEQQDAQQQQNTQNAKTISEGKAKNIALKDAGLSESDVEYIIANLEYDDGRTEYDVEFYTSSTEYSYTLDAVSGQILERDQEVREPYDD